LWGFEGGGALSSSPFGARRRRKQARKEELELPREDPASSPSREACKLLLLPLVRIKSSRSLILTSLEPKPRKYQFVTYITFAQNVASTT
jgi:hypothetical protein